MYRVTAHYPNGARTMEGDASKARAFVKGARDYCPGAHFTVERSQSGPKEKGAWLN